MVCMACLSIPLAFTGIGMSFNHMLFGLLVTILSLSIYLHYKEFSKCELCI